MTARPLTSMERARQDAETLGQRTTNSTPATIPTAPPATVEQALDLARKGFSVFPIAAGKKAPPLIQDFPNQASRDAQTITDWRTRWPDANTGISTTKYGDDAALLVVDCDGPEGAAHWARLQAQHGTAPETFTSKTPRGEHHYYTVPNAVKQSAGRLAPHVDIRSQGGYVVAPGSVVDGTRYIVLHERPLAPAPDWLIALCGEAKEKAAAPVIPIDGIDQGKAAARAKAYLLNDAPPALEGDGGDDTTFKVVCRVKDLGVDAETAEDLLSEHWNPRCQPPWSDEDLHTKVANAYKYGKDSIGVAAPEVEFSPVAEDPAVPKTLHPFAELNKTYGYIKSGSHIVRETTDADRRFKLERLTIPQFHTQLAPAKMEVGGKTRQLSDLWLHSKDRREYEGYVFMPRQDTPAGWYNLWRGFSRTAAATGDHPAVKSWVDHIRQNVCGGDPALARWFLSYCAHLIQTPSDKPLVAPVLVGEKGTGKTIVFEILGELLGSHYFLTANRRYLAGNFNGHLENCLLLVLDEAFWSGSKDVEGILKDLVTGTRHAIEHKGHAPYTVANKTRVVILSNSEWVVPASHDERRFAVFTVGTGRKQDRDFFRAMAEGMLAGGYEALLRYLLDYDLDLDGVDLNEAPKTEGLRAQQDRSLDPLPEWWLSCLTDGTIHGGPFEGWPSELSCGDFRSAFRRHCQERNITGRIPSDIGIGKLLKAFAPGIRKRQLSTEGRPRGYEIPPLDQARHEWDAHCPPGRVWE